MMKLAIGMSAFAPKVNSRTDAYYGILNFLFQYRKVESTVLAGGLAQTRDARGSASDTIKPLVAIAPCGGPVGKRSLDI